LSPPTARRAYDVTPDGRILGLLRPGQTAAGDRYQEIEVVLNWFEELKQKVPAKASRR
jgi:hypothetical protein